ncbi:MAG: glyoxalase superfamily protein [Pseudomonadota bacterium]
MTQDDEPRFEVVAPIFLVSDVPRARAYYSEALAFKVGFEWADADDEPVRYLIVQAGKVEVHLTKAEAVTPRFAYIFVDGVGDYYDTVTRRGAEIPEKLNDKPWNMREFAARDPDGNVLIFGEHLSRLSTPGS